MAIEIHSVTGKPVQGSRASDSSANPRVAKTSSAVDQSSDSLKLTDVAFQLQQADKSLARVPVVDSQRVDRVTSAINSGEYRINPERIADKMLQFEHQLPE